MIEEKIKSQKSKVKFKDKKVLVVGLARSGVGAANLLALLGARVCITDAKSRDVLSDHIKRLSSSVKVVVGEHPEEIFSSADLIVISPGVPLNIPPLVYASIKGVPVIGELELAYQVIKEMGQGSRVKGQGSNSGNDRPSPAPCSFIGITGTNGKSTTTTLVDIMLKEAGFKTMLGGNIGNALTEEILKTVNSEQYLVNSKEKDSSLVTCHPLPDFIVAEVSSFQLESIRDFKPSVSVILNITPDHLNRYDGMEGYIEAKARIFENQDAGDYLILNADDPEVMALYGSKIKNQSAKQMKTLFFSRIKEVDGIYYKDGSIFFKPSSTPETAPFRDLYGKGAVSPPQLLTGSDTIKIKGVHNLENAMAAALTALVCGCPVDAVKAVLADFPGLEHRLEFVSEIGGVRFINDSKGTNVGAVIKSLESLDDIVLIMGGRDKDGDFTVLRDLIQKKVKALVLIGEAAEKIAKAAGSEDTVFARDMREAVKISAAKASAGDVVLLSPGCASFDMFLDFEDRGRKFKEAVYMLKKTRVKG
ncbi:MAG: UDP-N-acetylmuramoyl-L-alanine--D-glutamate ligase [Nitrospirae bacterium]|nr:UDP-N-acetylmuramoyl-L-alanine--D-glutamate ligase [Nitrospirota bacterium]